MKSLAIVNCFDEMLDRGAHLGERFIVIHVDRFILERAHEALGVGVVIRDCRCTHADSDFVFLQHGDVVISGSLALIG